MKSQRVAKENFRLGWENTQVRRLERAIPYFEAAARCPELRERALAVLASCHMHFHNADADPADAAMSTYRQLVAAFPDRFSYWLSLGDGWLDCPAKAIDQSAEPMLCFENAIRLDPNSAAAQYGLAMLLQHKGDTTAAIDAYQRVLAIDPLHEVARFRLWSLWRQGRAPADVVPPPVSRPMQVEEYSGPSMFADLGRRPLAESKGRAAILRGCLSNLDFDLFLPFLAAVQAAHFQKTDTRLRFDQLPEPEHSTLREAIEGQILEPISSAWSDWPARGFLPHRHHTWFIHLQELGKEDRVTLLHQDHPVRSQNSDWLSIWIPFTPCGRGLAPSLRVYSNPLSEYIDIDGRFQRINLVPYALMFEYFDRSMIEVSALPGDVLVFGRDVLHETFVEPSMTERRISADIHYTIGPARLDLDFCNAIRDVV